MIKNTKNALQSIIEILNKQRGRNKKEHKFLCAFFINSCYIKINIIPKNQKLSSNFCCKERGYIILIIIYTTSYSVTPLDQKNYVISYLLNVNFYDDPSKNTFPSAPPLFSFPSNIPHVYIGFKQDKSPTTSPLLNQCKCIRYLHFRQIRIFFFF